LKNNNRFIIYSKTTKDKNIEGCFSPAKDIQDFHMASNR
jgi:hypothetical protein